MTELFTEPIFLIEVAIVILIVILQVCSYRANKKRMDDYMDVFSNSDSWSVETDEIGRVASIGGGSTNSFFQAIKHTINKYIAGTSDTVADYQILKEAVDRHCDSIEDQIESQNPVPLYLGLAGTMLGVILGLGSLIYSGAITDLAGVQDPQQVTTTVQEQVGSREAEFKKATDGIGSLLLGVAVAMFASLVGISLTTAAAWNYKKRKEDAERRKNEFMSWMQSVLLPELPNDMSGAMAQLVFDLEEFNTTFKENTSEMSKAFKDNISELSKTFKNVNESYKTQADIIKAVKEMDVQRMATANVQVLQQLERSTEKIERFNEYLNAIQGYTTTIQKFNEQFQQEETQLGLLKKIYEFFKQELQEIEQRKLAINDAVSSVDQHLRNSFTSLESSHDEQLKSFKEKLEVQATAFNVMLNEQRNTFKTMLDEQKVALENINKIVTEKIETELSQYPETVAQLNTISQIPSELRTLSSNLTRVMEKTTSDINRSISSFKSSTQGKNTSAPAVQTVVPKISIPQKFKYLLIGFLAFISLCSLSAAVFCGISAFRNIEHSPETSITSPNEVSESLATDTVNTNLSSDPQKIFEFVDQQPSFPGGNAALQSWLIQNLQYPAKAKEWGIKGNVMVSFVVEPNGTISEPSVVKGVDLLNEEAIRLVKNMPKWIPGKNKGKNVRTKCNLQIPFILK